MVFSLTALALSVSGSVQAIGACNPAFILQVEPLLERDPNAYLIFDDTVLEKSFGPEIEPTRYQYSGNAKDVIRGIGVVSLVYVNPKTEHFWVIDYRIFDPDTDGLTKIDHVREMLGSVSHRRLEYSTVLMDTWYATKELMLLIEQMGKTFYCPLKVNRSVDDSGAQRPYRRVWTRLSGASRSWS